MSRNHHSLLRFSWRKCSPLAPRTRSAFVAARCALFVIFGLSLNSGRAMARQPVPDKQSMSQAKELFDELFADRVKDATSAADRRALARKISQLAPDSAGDPAAYLVIQESAMKLYALAGDTVESMKIIDDMESKFELDLYVRRKQAIIAISRGATSSTERTDLAKYVSKVVDMALQHEDFAGGKQILQLGLSAAQKARATEVSRPLVEAKKSFEAKEKMFLAVADQLTALKTNPEDEQANLAVGRLRVSLGQWDRALDCFAKCSDSKLVELATLERAKSPASPIHEIVKMGDAWYELGKTFEGDTQKQVWARAVDRYGSVVEQLIGLSQVRVKKRLEEITPEEDKVVEVKSVAKDTLLFSGGEDNMAYAWDVNTGERVMQYTGHVGDVLVLARSLDGRLLATGSSDNSVRVFDRLSGAIGQVYRHTNDIVSVAISPDNSRLLSGDTMGRVKLWDLRSGQLLRDIFPTSGQRCYSIQYRRGGKQVAIAIGDSIRIVDTVTGNVGTLKGHTRSIRELAYSPNGMIFVSAGEGGNVLTWNANNGALMGTVNAHARAATSVAFSPDGKQIVTGSDDGTAKVWDVSSGQVIHTLDGHSTYVVSVDFSPTGKMIATGSWDRKIILWDAKTGNQLRQIDQVSTAHRVVKFAP